MMMHDHTNNRCFCSDCNEQRVGWCVLVCTGGFPVTRCIFSATMIIVSLSNWLLINYTGEWWMTAIMGGMAIPDHIVFVILQYQVRLVFVGPHI